MCQSQPFLFAQAVCDADDPGHANTVTHPDPNPHPADDHRANRHPDHWPRDPGRYTDRRWCRHQ
jgi:hypothetical protein